MRDSNQQKFYNFEKRMVNTYLPADLKDGLTLEESRELINNICASYNTKAPLVKEGRSNKIAYYLPLKHTIVLPPWAQRSYIIIHETAHALVGNKDEPSHGHTFVLKWCELFSRMYSVNKEELIQQAKKINLI